MNSRVSNAESYIFSAIIYIAKDNFTSNDVAQILIERFSLPKSYFKAKAFAYNQIQCLVRKGLLSKVRKSGAYQYVYSVTSEFNVIKKSVELIEAPQKKFQSTCFKCYQSWIQKCKYSNKNSYWKIQQRVGKSIRSKGDLWRVDNCRAEQGKWIQETFSRTREKTHQDKWKNKHIDWGF